MSILIVDDSEEVREIFEAVLVDGGYHDLTTLGSAAAALSFLGVDAPLVPQRNQVDVVFLDVIMPEMNGIEACAQIRRDPRYVDIPIVMTTSLDDIESIEKAFQSGATDYLTKPLKVVDLLACVRSKIKLKADLDRRNALERELMKHLPFCFDSYTNR